MADHKYERRNMTNMQTELRNGQSDLSQRRQTLPNLPRHLSDITFGGKQTIETEQKVKKSLGFRNLNRKSASEHGTEQSKEIRKIHLESAIHPSQDRNRMHFLILKFRGSKSLKEGHL